jgi:hypothetical protein
MASEGVRVTKSNDTRNAARYCLRSTGEFSGISFQSRIPLMVTTSSNQIRPCGSRYASRAAWRSWAT